MYLISRYVYNETLFIEHTQDWQRKKKKGSTMRLTNKQMRPENTQLRNVTHEYVNAYQPLLLRRRVCSMMDYIAS